MSADRRDRIAGPRVTVIGPGAIGGSIGASLQLAGFPVDVVARPGSHLQAIRERGLRLEGARGTFEVRFAAVRETGDDIGRLELVLLAVKAQQTEAAARLVARHLADDGVVVTLQNGLGAEIVARAVGVEHVLPAMVHLPAERPEPGRVVRPREGEIYIGEWDGRFTPRLEDVRQRLSPAARINVTENVWGFVWSKLAFACMQCAQALVDAPTSEVMSEDWARRICAAIESEVAEAARASGVRLESYARIDASALPVRTAADLDRTIAMLPRGSASGHNVYWRDLVRRVRGEVHELAGAAVRVGRAHGLPMRLNARVVELTHEIEEGRREMSWDNLRALEAPTRDLLAAAM